MNNLFNTKEVLVLRALHEKDDHPLSRAKFFFIALVCSFLWYVVPGYLFMGVLGILQVSYSSADRLRHEGPSHLIGLPWHHSCPAL